MRRATLWPLPSFKWDQITVFEAFEGVKPSEGEGVSGMLWRVELREMEQNKSLGIFSLVVGTISSQESHEVGHSSNGSKRYHLGGI